MEKEIVAAIIAGAVTLLGIVLGQFLLRRQAAKDLRAIIDREIDIVRRLRPDSEEAYLLEAHISKSIKLLIRSETNRGLLAKHVRPVLYLIAASLLVLGLLQWRSHVDLGQGWNWVRDKAIILAWVIYVLSLIPTGFSTFKLMQPVALSMAKRLAVTFRRIQHQLRLTRLKVALWAVKRKIQPVLVAIQDLSEEEREGYLGEYGARRWIDLIGQRRRILEQIANLNKLFYEANQSFVEADGIELSSSHYLDLSKRVRIDSAESS